MSPREKTPPWFELAATRAKDQFTGQSELAAATERRVIEAVTQRKRKPKAIWLIPLTLVGSGSLAWAEEVERVVTWTVQHVQELVRSGEPPTEKASDTASAKRPTPARQHHAAAPTLGPHHEDTAEASTSDSTPTETTAAEVIVSPRVEGSRSLHASSAKPSNGTAARAPVESATGADSAAATPSDLERYRTGYTAQYERNDYGAALLAWDAYLQHVPGGRFTPDVRYHRALALAELGRSREAITALRPFVAGAYGPLRKQSAINLVRKLGAPEQ